MKKTILIIASIVLLLSSCQKTRFSVLGDSYSTFKGFVDPENNDVWPNYDTTGVCKVKQVWWYQVAKGMGWMLEKNNSFSGSLICNLDYKSYFGPHSFLRRMDDLGNPDVILVFGGTNDMRDEAPMGDYVYDDWTEEELCTFRPALACLFEGLKQHYPDAKLWFLADSALGEEFMESVHVIAEHYQVSCIDLHDIETYWKHPTAKGMETIANQTLEALKQD